MFVVDGEFDRMHNHLSIGFVVGCPGCDQVRQDFEFPKMIKKMKKKLLFEGAPSG